MTTFVNKIGGLNELTNCTKNEQAVKIIHAQNHAQYK